MKLNFENLKRLICGDSLYLGCFMYTCYYTMRWIYTVIHKAKILRRLCCDFTIAQWPLTEGCVCMGCCLVVGECTDSVLYVVIVVIQ